ncbi:MAG: T9SS type A sorting domain-containing protein, partial [Bacteroidota bacterium]
IVNSIFWGNYNDPNSFPLPALSYLYDPNGNLSVSYSIMEYGWPGVANINANPLFVNPAADNFRLLAGSPGINSGLNAAAIGPRDLDGNFRISGPSVDRGPYESANSKISGFIMVDALTQEKLFLLEEGGVYELPKNPVNIMAISDGEVKSVAFELAGSIDFSKVENLEPWALFGDNEGKLNPGFLFNGTYKLLATPYSEMDGEGAAGSAFGVSFQIVGQAPSFNEEAEKMSAYPNPSNGVFSLQFPESWTSPASVRITDKMGNVVWTGKFQNPKIETRIQLPELFDGVYMLQAVSGKQMETLRLVITK